MYGSSLFTALGDGRTSALLSVWDTLICLLGFLLLWQKRKQYGYL